MVGSRVRVVPIDAAIERVGVGAAQLPTLLAAGLTWSGDAMELSVVAYVLPVIKDAWGISQAATDAFASVVFAGMLVGALGWGAFSDLFGRRVGWFATTALTACAGLASAAAPDGAAGAFLTARAFVGVGLAGTNLGFALSCEVLPSRSRGTLLMLFELWFVFGSVLVGLLALLLLNQAGGWRWVLVLSTLPLWLALSLSRFVTESPRWLAGRGDTAAALRVLERAARVNRRPPPLGSSEVGPFRASGRPLGCLELPPSAAAFSCHIEPPCG